MNNKEKTVAQIVLGQQNEPFKVDKKIEKSVRKTNKLILQHKILPIYSYSEDYYDWAYKCVDDIRERIDEHGWYDGEFFKDDMDIYKRFYAGEIYKNLGIKILGKYNNKFYKVEYPAGWDVKPSVKNRYGTVYTISYGGILKMALYYGCDDDYAEISFFTRYTTLINDEDSYGNIYDTKTSTIEYRYKGYAEYDTLLELRSVLDLVAPDWHNPLAYWNDGFDIRVPLRKYLQERREGKYLNLNKE